MSEAPIAPRQSEPPPAPAAREPGAAMPAAAARRAHGRWQALPAWLLAAALVGGLAAIGLGLALAGGHKNAAGAPVVLNRQVATGPLRFSYPSTWSFQPALSVPGLQLSNAVTVGSTKRPQGQLVIGTVASAQSGLPAAFMSTLSGQPEPDLVSLGNQQYYRLLDSGLTGGGGGEAVYVLASGGRTVVAVCRAGVQPFAALCERVLGTLQIRPVPGPAPAALSATYVTGLNTILTSLSTDRKRDLAALAAAHTAASQGKTALALSALHHRAATAVRALPAGSAGHQNDALGNALIHMSYAYAALSRAAARHLPRAYASAQAEIARANSEIAAALAALKKLGYQVA